jgi:HK97 family phage prohead protease
MDHNLIRHWATPVSVQNNVLTGMGLVYYDGTAGTKHEFLPGKFEGLAPGAQIVKHREDVLCCFNHDLGKVLGRESNGKLKLTPMAQGVAYSVELNPQDQEHLSIAAKITRGDAKGSSANFKPLAYVWKDGVLLFTKILLVEIGPVTSPAMLSTINYSEQGSKLSNLHWETQRRLSDFK